MVATSPKLPFERRLLAGYGGAQQSNSLVASINSIDDCRLALDQCRRDGQTVALLGASCSFGDQMLNRPGVVLDMTPMNAIESWDPLTGRLSVQAGVRIADILRLTLLDGWILTGIPGSLSVTVGGAIANNVHGKDTAKNGNFGQSVRSLTLLLANGECLDLDIQRDHDLMMGVIGGMGLLGVIVKAELQLVRVPAQTLEIETCVSNSVEETIADLDSDGDWEFRQAWTDSSAGGRSAGRGFVKLARFVGADDRPPSPERIEASLQVNSKILGMPSVAFWRTMRPLFLPPLMGLVNNAYYYKAKVGTWATGITTKEAFTDFYFFHNNIPDFYSTYKPPGFLEIQALFPRAACPSVCRGFIELAPKCGLTPVLSGMKRHMADDALISFEGDGFAPSVDFHLQGRDPADVDRGMRRLFEFVAANGGKVNLSKDEKLPKDLFQVMYPKAGQFWSLKEKLDPNHLFMSDMARRLFY